MNADHRTIFSLVAAGRITAAEAERLLAASSDAREVAWIVALCALACMMPLHGVGVGPDFIAAIPHALHAAFASAMQLLQHIVSIALHCIGGRP